MAVPRGSSENDYADGGDPVGSYAAEWSRVVATVGGLQTLVMEDVEHACGVTASSFFVLSSLLRADQHRLAMNVLTAELGMTSGGFTKLADRLERAGLIQRRSSPTDRRIVFAALTGDGVDAAREADSAYRSSVAVRVQPLIGQDQLQALREMLGNPAPS